MSLENFCFASTLVIHSKECYDIQHNGTQHNDTQHNDTHHNDTQHNGTQHNDTQHNGTGTQHNCAQHNGTQHKRHLTQEKENVTLSTKTLLTLGGAMLSEVSRFIYYYAECLYAEWGYVLAPKNVLDKLHRHDGLKSTKTA